MVHCSALVCAAAELNETESEAAPPGTPAAEETASAAADNIEVPVSALSATKRHRDFISGARFAQKVT